MSLVTVRSPYTMCHRRTELNESQKRRVYCCSTLLFLCLFSKLLYVKEIASLLVLQALCEDLTKKAADLTSENESLKRVCVNPT